MVDSRNSILKKIVRPIDDDPNPAKNHGLGWLFLAVWCFILAGTASYITVNIAPGANGSGIPEVMAYLNGVNIPDYIGWKTYLTKTFCVVMAISAQLFIGKEGPLVQIGSNVGQIVLYFIPIDGFKYF